MSAITFNWAPFEIETAVEAPASTPVKISTGRSREEEFRAALDIYFATYLKNRASIAAKCSLLPKS